MKSDGTTITTTRHDLLPFGEEIQAGIGGRTTGQGYVADGVRQKFTQKERDNESGLDYFGARYYSSAQGRFTSHDPIFVTAKRLVDPQRLNQYAYTRNNPLKFFDPDGMDLALTAKNSDEAEKRFKVFQLGLRKEDRSHVHLVVGNGKNGFGKGQFGLTVDKGYKSDSGNFQAVQKAANDHTVVGRISVVNVGDEVALRNTELRNNRTVLVVATFKFQNEFDGYTFFQYRGKDQDVGFSRGPFTESYIRGDQDEAALAATIHHELRAHMVLGDFGRNVPRSKHSDAYARGQGLPTTEADKEGEAAEKEATENAAKKP